VISSIKSHLPHLPHIGRDHHSHSHSRPSSSHSELSAYSTYKPSHQSSSSVHFERPEVSYKRTEKVYEVDNRPQSVVSETKVIKETQIIPESVKLSDSSASGSSSSSSSSSSLSDKSFDKSSAKFSDKSSDKSASYKMGNKFDFEYEHSSSGHGGHGGHGHGNLEYGMVTESYKNNDYNNGHSHISSVHAPKSSTFTIPCHHIRIGDLVILQHRPCQVIRITTSAQTGQHRYLGVDLFTKQLHEEPCVVSHPSPSVVLHSLLGPVFKQYRLIDIRDDGRLVAMTESGEIKQGLKVVDQGRLWNRLKEAFGRGSGSVRVLVISDHGKELAVDYKTVHLAHKL
jgi:hypothetical protein